MAPPSPSDGAQTSAGMFIFLSKFLPVFIYPLGLACVLLVIAILLRRRRWQTAILVAVLLLLWLGGNRWVEYGLVHTLESRHPTPDPLPSAPVIVVLGGGTRSNTASRPFSETNEAGDRLLYAAWLYKQGKAPHILVTGGSIEWRGPRNPEAEDMVSVLTLTGVPEEAIWLEPEARNTYENALFSREMLAARGIDTILLVTSARHMPRSLRLFERQGLHVIPAPTDYLTSAGEWSGLTAPDLRNYLIQLLPEAESLYWTSEAMKEYIGILIYSLRGWM